MLRVLGIICDIFMILSFAFGLVVALYFFAQITQLPLPLALINGLETLMSPFLHAIRESFGPREFTMKGETYDLSYGILVMLCMLSFIVFLVLSNLVHGLHHKLLAAINWIRHQLFMWKKRQESQAPITSLGNLYVPEVGAVAALCFENYDYYPNLRTDLEKRLNILNVKQKVVIQDDKVLLKFNSTAQAFMFIYDYYRQFKKTVETMPLVVDRRPVYKAAVHSLTSENTLFEDESFIWALLACAAPFQVFASTNAKEQFDMHRKSMDLSFPFEVVQVGTFAKLGNRTQPDVYRLSFYREELEEVG